MKKSQDKLVLEHLQSGKAISSWLAIKKWGHTRLSRSINTLRKNHTIYSIYEQHGDKRFKIYYQSNSRYFKVYGAKF